MTPFMERVAEVLAGGARAGQPGLRPSAPRPVVIGADEQVMTRALAEQLVSEANAVLINRGPTKTGLANTGLANTGLANTGLANTGLANTGLANTGLANTGLANTGLAAGGQGIGLEDELGEGRLSFVMRYRARYARVSTSFERRASVGHLHGTGAGGAGEVALDGPEQLERLILLLLTEPD